MRAFAVIGAAYGDEGKGAAVDALAAASASPLVVRHNGGAQAGHTVVTPRGVRHVFSHFGSGALAGAPTYLSHFFAVNPKIFLNEWVELSKKGGNTNVTLSPNCQVTTPWDVMVNRWAESERGKDCHGSVGIGFGETVGRSLCLMASDVFSPLAGDIKYLRDYMPKFQEWAVNRLAQLNIPLTLGRRSAIYDEGTLETFLDEVEVMSDMIEMRHADVMNAYDTIIFEGAQGLLLDQDHGHKFPYLTRSNTGLRNVMTLARVFDSTSIDVRYITRCYTTRHGAGPLDFEGELEGVDVVDATNTDRPWQGPFRTAPLCVVRIADAIYGDLRRSQGSIDIDPGIVMTCMDQVKDGRRSILSGLGYHTRPIPIRYETYGPSSREVVK